MRSRPLRLHTFVASLVLPLAYASHGLAQAPGGAVAEETEVETTAPPPAGTVNVAPASPAGAPAEAAPLAAGPGAPPPAFSPPKRDLGFTREDAERAHFSGGRYILELLVSGVGGSAAAYGTFVAICGDDPCIGGALAGAGANIIATPLLTMGSGALLGGRGGFMMTALFGLLGFTATAPLSSTNPTLALGVSLALMPILAPIGYELSSNGRAKEMELELGVSSARLKLMPIVAPLRFGGRTTGGIIGVGGAF